MKKILTLLFYTILINQLWAQNVAINNDGSQPNASAMLDIKNSNKGVLIPRVSLLSETDNTTIPNPQTSLLIYNINAALPDGDGFYFWNGAKWNKFATRSNLANLTWNVGGNAGTNTATDFIGTTDNKGLVFKTNNILSGKIEPGPNNIFFGQSAGLNITSGTNNSFYGQNAGIATTTGSGNLFAGHNAGASITTGNTNVFLGQGAGKINAISDNSVFIGNEAGFNNLASENVAIGAEALRSNTSGIKNTAIGFQNLNANTTGNSNTSIGHQSLFSNTIGTSNTAIGESAMNFNTTGAYNTAAGKSTLQANTKGSSNTAIGYYTLSENTTGIDNTATGYAAMQHNSNGDRNTATGYQAMLFNTTGYENTAMGFEALMNNTTGFYNVAVGREALVYNTNGDRNAALGTDALFNNVSGFQNTACGNSALSENLVGDYNSALGYSSGPVAGFTSLNNTTTVGYNARVSTSNTMVFGDANVDRWAFGIYTTGAQHALEVGTNNTNGNGAYLTQGGNWVNTSSRIKKEDFSDINGNDLLQKIQQLPIQKWKYKGTDEYHIGPVAEDFYELFGLGTDDKGISTVDPSGVALAAIKEQQKIIEGLKALILKLQKRIDAVEKK